MHAECICPDCDSYQIIPTYEYPGDFEWSCDTCGLTMTIDDWLKYEADE